MNRDEIITAIRNLPVNERMATNIGPYLSIGFEQDNISGKYTWHAFIVRKRWTYPVENGRVQMWETLDGAKDDFIKRLDEIKEPS